MGANLAADEQFGPYLVYERLGVGGMATVHRALERGIEGFERVVALKRLLPHLAEDASFIKSFVREAKLASLLNHHNIVQIYELGRVSTEYFISMEYIDGNDIRRILRHARKVSGAPPIHVTVGILIQLAEALDYAHTKCDDHGQPLKLVHRDISPSNLIVTPSGHLKVIDFGIAKAQSSQLHTQTGRVKGKLAYMAPEAVSSAKDLDARSDLWAAGVIAHELLTARPLFASKNEYQTLLKVQRGDIIAPSTFNQACPPELDAIVAKLLARDPDERYLDATALRDALIELRRTMKLQTGTRDIATWLEWAFSLEVPGGFAQQTGDRSGGTASGAFDLQASARSLAGMSSTHITPAPKPRREDDEAVEIAWGGGEDVGPGKPIELDDVPDVSEKHYSAKAPASQAPQDDANDDIPAPEPSHGVVRPKRDTDRSASIELPLAAPAKIVTPERRVLPSGVTARADTLDVPSADEVVVHARAPSEMSEELQPRDTQRSIPSFESRPPDDEPKPKWIPSTIPGVGEPPIRKSLADMVDHQVATPPRPKRPSVNRAVSIGDAIVARESVRSRAWLWIVVFVIVGGGAAAFVLVSESKPETVSDVTRPMVETAKLEQTPVEKTPPRGTLKFIVEPADVSIRIVGVAQHEGSPWSIDLAPGAHKIELRRAGFKPRVTAIELSSNETQTLLINLEKAPRRVGRGLGGLSSTLILDSDPQGLEVMIDGRVVSERTPMTRVIPAGPHDIGIRKNGIVLWRQHLIAEADADHEFRPVFTEQKVRERRQRVVGPAWPVEPEPVPQTVDAATEPPEPDPSPIAIAPPVEPPPPPPTPTPPPVVPRVTTKPALPTATGPLMVAPNAVKRLVGEPPTLGASKPQNMPPVVAAKVCIDPAGVVTGVEIITKLERHTTSDLAATIKNWRYAPYKQEGTAVPACFSVNFRVK